jgi:deazaflavin-dependent oxidoreductase (nitroreductase family)
MSSDLRQPAAAGPPPGMARRARSMRVINVPMRRVLGLPFATPLSGSLMLVYLTGRKTGTPYRQPVSYVRHDGALLTPGGGRWKLNLVPGAPVRIRLRGRPVTAWPEVVSDPAEVDELLGVITAANPRAARFIPIPRRPDGHAEPAALAAALDHGFRIVRWRLTPPAA